MIQPTVLVPAYRRPDLTRRALASLRAGGAARILLIDDEASASGSELSAEFPGLEVLTTTAPVYWTGAIVLGIEHCVARGDASVLFFNQDVTLEADYFERLSETAAQYPDALIGSAVLYRQLPGVVWSAGGRVEWLGRGIRVLYHGAPVSRLPSEPYPVDWLFGMGTLVRAELLGRLGLPDARRFPQAWGDTDFSLRARAAGIPVLVDPRARLCHEVGGYDARIGGPPTPRVYLSWLADPRHNLSLSAQAEVWRRHGPRGLWPLSFVLRVLVLLANFFRIRLLFRKGPGETPKGLPHCFRKRRNR